MVKHVPQPVLRAAAAGDPASAGALLQVVCVVTAAGSASIVHCLQPWVLLGADEGRRCCSVMDGFCMAARQKCCAAGTRWGGRRVPALSAIVQEAPSRGILPASGRRLHGPFKQALQTTPCIVSLLSGCADMLDVVRWVAKGMAALGSQLLCRGLRPCCAMHIRSAAAEQETHVASLIRGPS